MGSLASASTVLSTSATRSARRPRRLLPSRANRRREVPLDPLPLSSLPAPSPLLHQVRTVPPLLHQVGTVLGLPPPPDPQRPHHHKTPAASHSFRPLSHLA